MSYVSIFRVDEDGDVTYHDCSNNNHGGAPLIWRFLSVQYNLHPTGKPNEMPTPYGYEALWGMMGKGKLERKDEILLGMTLDRVWVPKALVPELTGALMAFHQRYIVSRDLVETIKGIAEVIQHLYEETPNARGVAFNMCSASDDIWTVRDGEDKRPYNIDKDNNGHWELVPSV